MENGKKLKEKLGLDKCFCKCGGGERLKHKIEEIKRRRDEKKLFEAMSPSFSRRSFHRRPFRNLWTRRRRTRPNDNDTTNNSRWRKLYLVNGHRYQPKRFARTALCSVCQDRIWGLGRQGYKCLGCKVMVHKRCHKFILSQCPASNSAPSSHSSSHLVHSHSMINPLASIDNQTSNVVVADSKGSTNKRFYFIFKLI